MLEKKIYATYLCDYTNVLDEVQILYPILRMWTLRTVSHICFLNLVSGSLDEHGTVEYVSLLLECPCSVVLWIMKIEPNWKI